MPTVRWRGVVDAEGAARMVGPRIRQLRESRGLTIRDLAARARTSKNTLLRLEQGLPVTETVLTRICDQLQTILPNLLEIDLDAGEQKVKVYRDDANAWRIAFRRSAAPSLYQDFDVVADPRERMRIGGLGYVSGFLQTHGSMLTGGRLQAAVVELYGEQERAGFRHSGEEFVYCLEGVLRLRVGDEVHDLAAGDSALFWSRHRHRYSSAHERCAARMLMVWFEAPEEELARSHDDECDDPD